MWLVLQTLAVALLLAAAAGLLRARTRRLLAASLRLPGPRLPRLTLGADPLATVEQLCRRYGAPCRVWVGLRLYVLVSAPEHAQAVLGGDSFHERARCQAEVLRPFTGGGLLTATAQGWRPRRRLVERALTPEWVRSQSGWMRRVADRLVAALQSRQGGGGGDDPRVAREAGACALDALSGCLLGQQTRATGRAEAGFSHVCRGAAQLLRDVASRPLLCLLPRPLLMLTSLGQAQARLARQLRAHVDAAVDTAAHSSTRDQEGHIALHWERSADAGDDADRLAGSVLERLLAECGDRQLVREEVTSLLLAGQPATEAALCFCLQLLALHPQVQSAAAGDPQLLRRAVLESLRLYPVSPLLSRQLAENVQLPRSKGASNRECALPAGCSVLVCPLLTHRDPLHWPQPDAFQPDRFLEDPSQQRHGFAFLAFGAGPRRCPASELSLELLCTALSRLLAAFTVVSSSSREDLEDLRMHLLLAPAGGFQLQLVPRSVM